ncbi:MAG: glucose 1-dehydrogenase [Acidimicrobiia bacterium]|nr:glucose 1-dehydrogenase [Acidimicrobiia bacterium]
MATGFQGKVAVVTGGGSGIGRAAAIAFGAAGAKVVVANRTASSGNATVDAIRKAGGDAIYVSTDVAKAAAVEALMTKAASQFGRIDFLCASAGSQPTPGPMLDETEDAWNLNLDVNLKGTWLAMKYAIPHMLKVGGGSIVSVAAATGLVGFANWTSQCASKHGVVGLTKSVALEFAKQNVRVNCVCPGLVRTPMTETLAGGAANVDGLAAMEPVGRLGTPEELAATIVFLCSDGAGFITGQALAVDGGMVAG